MTQFDNGENIMWNTRLESKAGGPSKRYSRRYSGKLWPFSPLSVFGWVRCLFGVPVLLALGWCSLFSLEILSNKKADFVNLFRPLGRSGRTRP